MSLLLSFSLVLHFIVLGLVLGHSRKAITLTRTLAVFVYLFAFHTALGYGLAAVPQFVEPRAD